MDKKCLSGRLLKWIAIIAMILDHTAYVFVPKVTVLYFVMRFIGRIAGPTMFFFLVEGYHHTKNVKKYILRLFLFALIAYIPFIYCFFGSLPNQHNFYSLNIMYTLGIGLLAIHVKNVLKPKWLAVCLIFVLGVMSFVGDWSIIGFIIIMIFESSYGNKKMQIRNYLIAAILYIGIESISYVYIMHTNGFIDIMLNMISLGMFLPAFILKNYNGNRGKVSNIEKWAFYWVYPLHLMILIFIRYIYIIGIT
jgi:TraX protein.